ncbi:Vacuolar protein sorting-associated protein 11 [Dispira simplex]|nr:Vacuolar protein sorting-associated protein 11 [Dispira simplex]
MGSTFRLRKFNFFTQEEIPQLPAAFDEPGLLITATQGHVGVQLDPLYYENTASADDTSTQDHLVNRVTSSPTWRTITGGTDSGYLFLASPKANTVHIVDRKFTVRSKLVVLPADPPSRLTHIRCVAADNVMVTVHEFGTNEGLPRAPWVRVWNLAKIFHANYQPVTIKLQKYSDTPFPVTTLAALETTGQLALGFTNGMVVLVRSSKLGQDRYPKQRLVHETAEPITGLAFAEEADEDLLAVGETGTGSEGGDLANQPLGLRKPGEQTSGMARAMGRSSTVQPEAKSRTLLYVTTTSQILCIQTSTAPGREIKSVLDQEGCALHNCFVNNRSELIVAREEAIYFYTSEGRGPCFAFEGTKLSMQGFKDYVILLTNLEQDFGGVGLLTDRRGSSSEGPHLWNIKKTTGSMGTMGVVDENGDNKRSGSVVLQILDMKNKLLAFMGTYQSDHTHVLNEWGGVFVCSQLRKTSPRGSDTDDASSADGEGDSTSLRSSRTSCMYRLEEKSLTQKLEILYKQNLYPLAVQMATRSRYNPENIAEIYQRYGDYLYSQDDYDGAMDQYLYTVGYIEPSYVIRKFLDAQRLNHLTTYLETLHQQGLASADHTTLLLNCYTKLKAEDRLSRFLQSDTGDNLQFDVDTAIKVCRQAGYAHHALTLAERFGQHDIYLDIQMEDVGDYPQVIRYLRGCVPDVEARAAYIERYGKRLLVDLPEETTQLAIATCTSSADTGSHSAGSLPNPRRFQNLFVDSPDYLVQFLERVREKRWPETTVPRDTGEESPSLVDPNELEDRKAVWCTLLELYLETWSRANELTALDGHDDRSSESPTVANSVSLGEKATLAANKVMGLLLETQVPYDWDQAFTLCDTAQFDQGTTWLYESRGLYQELFQFYMDREDVEIMLGLLDKWGTKEPTLYAQALNYLVSSSAVLTTHMDDLRPLLEKIEELNLLPPLQVIQILSRHSVAKLGLVKDYLIRCLRAERTLINQDKKLITSYREETAAMQEEIRQLQTDPIVFQGTKCSLCQAPLDLPAIHFLCRHSYHQRCLGEADQDCPRCYRENQMVADIVRNQDATLAHTDRFLHKLENAKDGFDVITEYFSKGAFPSALDLQD